MSKLIDTAKLARLAKALDDRAKALFNAEQQRALAAEQALQASIDAINNGETGLLKQAKDYADSKDTELKGYVDEQDEAIGERIGVVEGRLDVIDNAQTEQDGKIQANADAIAAINNAETGLLKQAKDYADEQDTAQREAINEIIEALQADVDQNEADCDAAIKAEKERAEGKEGELLAAINKEVEDRETAIEELNETLDGKFAGIETAQGVQDGRILANEQAIGVLNGDENQEGSVKKQIKDAIDEVNGVAEGLDGRVGALEAEQITQNSAIEAAQAAADKAQEEVNAVEERMLTAEGRLDDIDGELDDHDGRITAAQAAADKAQGEVDAVELRVKANEDAIGVLNGGEDKDGSVAKAVKDAIDPVQADLDALEAIVGEAAEGEQAATGLHKLVVDGDAKTLEDAKKYADEQITALVDSAPDAMNTLNELASAISDHQDVYDAYVAKISGELDKKVDKVEGSRLASETEIAKWNAKAEVSDVEQALQDAKDYADEQIAEVNGNAEVIDGRVGALEEKVGHDVEGTTPATGLFLEVDQAKAAADQAQEEVNAVEGRVDVVEGRLDAIDADQVEQENAIKANTDAIGVLNGGAEVEGSVAKSIADALETYSTTEEMKGIIGTVVQSLALTMENDKVVLKLGGEEGIALTEVSLDLATDSDIDGIINGLDAE